MEMPLSIVSEDSEGSLDSDDESEEIVDPFQPPFPTWSTRFYCLQAYCCFILSYFNTLKFCESVGKYGFIIFLPYCLFNCFFGAGAVLVEMLLGRYVVGNIARAWNMCPLSRGVLWCLFATTFVTIIYDHLSNVFLLKYLFASFGDSLPWETCDPEWAEENCYELNHKYSALAKCERKFSREYCRNLTWQTAATQYWNTRICGVEDIADIMWTVSCLAISVLLAFAVSYKGIRSAEKFFPIFVYPMVVLWLLNACVCLVIPNALQGLRQLCKMKWENLFVIKFWLDGFSDAVYFLGLGKLTLSFISSHGRFTDNILLDVIIVSSGGLFFSAVITMPILSMIAGIKAPIKDEEETFMHVNQMFIYMSEAMTHYPYPKYLWSILSYFNWFVMSSSAQVLSVLAICEATEGVLRFKKNIFFGILTVFSFISFGMGIVVVFFPVLYHIKVAKFLTVLLLLSTITWQFGYGIWRLNKDYYFMMGRPLPIFMKASWISVSLIPMFVLFLTLVHSLAQSPSVPNSDAYFLIPPGIYVLSMCSRIFEFSKKDRGMVEVFQPYSDWGPENPILKKSRALFDSTTAPREVLYRQELCNRVFTKPPDISRQNVVHLI